MSALPSYKGWTMDAKLREFRKVTWRKGEPSMQTVPFDSPKGRKLIEELRADARRVPGIRMNDDPMGRLFGA